MDGSDASGAGVPSGRMKEIELVEVAAGRLTCSIGVMAYNEERNIGQLLEALRVQALLSCRLAEIVVVASGCTDRTEGIVETAARRDPRVRLVRQTRREGKARAINIFFPPTK